MVVSPIIRAIFVHFERMGTPGHASVGSLEVNVGGLATEEAQHPSKNAVRFHTTAAAAVSQGDFVSSTGMGSEASTLQLRNREHGSARGWAGSSPAENGIKERVGASLLSAPLGDDGEDEQDDRRNKRRKAVRNDAAFWLLGLINNSTYVIMMAVAKEIAPDAVGVVFLADVAPTMLVKVSAPYW